MTTVTALTAARVQQYINSSLKWVNAVEQFGADPTGVADSTTAILAAISALPSTGGVVYLPAGRYKASSTLTATRLPVIIKGDGRWATQVNFTGTGDCIRMFTTSNASTQQWGGGVQDLTIDGTSAGAGSTGLHIGDNAYYQLDLQVQNFSGVGSIGVHLDNQNWWTEECRGTISSRNNTRGIVFDVSGANTATNSFAYLDLTCYVQALANQDGVVVQNGAYLYHGRLAIKGNFSGSASPVSNGVLRVAGSVPAGHPGAGSFSQIVRCQLDIQVEVGSFANQPSTIIFGTAGSNAIQGCYGIMDFTQGAGSFAGSNVIPSASAGTLSYEGLIVGDGNLNPAGNFPQPVTVGTKLYSKTFLNGANGSAFIQWGDFLSATLSASITINLTPGGVATMAAPQRKTLVIKQAASGGPFTVTWPHTGSPTTSAPTVNWPGGTAPTMTATAGAVDVYKLETYDGATWYGQALQNVS